MRDCSTYATDRDFLYGVEARADAREKAITRFQVVVLRAHAVDRDVDRALRQAVDRGIARPARAARCADPRQQRDKLESPAAACRNLQDLIGVDRRCHRRRRRLDNLGAAGHDDGFFQSPDGKGHLDRCWRRSVDAHVNRRTNRQGVGAGVGAGILAMEV